ncbi:MAG TPA: hypothetical protein VLF67_01030 [Candidatus Saccharimonas sp.]|nr:hypothetical protein [Candidatus Saccharimonas sp.]
MSTRGYYLLAVGVGTTVGSFVPYLWGDTNFLSGWSILLSGVGGIVGIWLVHRYLA